MKKIILCIWLVVMLVVPLFSMAETMIVPINADFMYEALYVSSDEIYLSGPTAKGSWLLKVNSQGEILDSWEFSGFLGEQPVIQCIGKADEALLLGFVDSYTQNASIGVMEGSEIIYYPLPQGEQVLPGGMSSDPQGISIISSTMQGDRITLTISRFTPENHFELQQVIGSSSKEDMNIMDSIALSAKDTHFVLKKTKMDGVVTNCHREIVALDPEGRIKWEAFLPETAIIEGIATDGTGLYLYGSDKTDAAVCGLLMCCTPSGEIKWSKTFDEVERFTQAQVNEYGICLIGEKTCYSAQWTAFQLDFSGEKQLRLSLEPVHGQDLRGFDSSDPNTFVLFGNMDNAPFMAYMAK